MQLWFDGLHLRCAGDGLDLLWTAVRMSVSGTDSGQPLLPGSVAVRLCVRFGGGANLYVHVFALDVRPGRLLIASRRVTRYRHIDQKR